MLTLQFLKKSIMKKYEIIKMFSLIMILIKNCPVKTLKTPGKAHNRLQALPLFL
jgi:hypothetical protein